MRGRLKAMCKVLGNDSYKEKLLNGCFKPADAYARHLIHRFSAEHVDWRWEYLEDLSCDIDYKWPVLEKFWNHAVVTNDGALRAKDVDLVHKAIVNDLNGVPGFACSNSAVAMISGQLA